MNKFFKYLVLIILLCSITFIFFYKDILSSKKTETETKTITGVPTMLEFMTLTCPACKELAPTIEKIKKEYSSRVNIKVINANIQQDLASKYEIMYVPTLIFLDKDGNVYKKQVGVMSKENIEEIFKEMGVK